jgi:hypothetical protein
MEGRADGALTLDGVAVERIAADQLAARYGFVSVPSAPRTLTETVSGLATD